MMRQTKEQTDKKPYVRMSLLSINATISNIDKRMLFQQ